MIRDSRHEHTSRRYLFSTPRFRAWRGQPRGAQATDGNGGLRLSFRPALARSPPSSAENQRALTTTPDEALQTKLDEALAWLNASADHHLLTWAHSAFPQALLESGDAPIVLYAKGRINLPEQARHRDGRFAQLLARWRGHRRRSLNVCRSCHGVCVVSGMAEGIDAASHVGALRATNEGARRHDRGDRHRH